MTIRKQWRRAVLTAPLLLAIAAPGAAQAPAASAGLEEIIVTARKREENLQDVPLAVTAIGEEQLQRQGIKTVENIIATDPSLSFDLGIAQYDTRIVVRGLSPTRGRPNVATLIDGIDVSSEAIGVAGGSLLINPRLVDIARVEIVKGPQSALYGRSAFAGAVQYITQDPAKELGGNLAVDLSSREQSELKASLSIPLGETLGVRLNGYAYDDDGYWRNSLSGEKLGGGDGAGASMTLRWTPDGPYSLKFRGEYSDDSFDPAPWANVDFNTLAPIPAAASSCRVYTATGVDPMTGQTISVQGTGPVLDPSCATLDNGVPNPVRTLELASGSQGTFNDAAMRSFRGAFPDAENLSVTFNRDYARTRDNGATAPGHEGSNRRVRRLAAVQDLSLRYGTFASLTGYTLADVASNVDFDKTAHTTIMQTLNTRNRTEQFSQELRFTSDFDGPVQFISGLQYWTERADQFDRNLTVIGAGTACVIPFPMAPCIGGGTTSTGVAQYFDDTAAARPTSFVRRLVDHQSAYLEIEWSIMDRLRLIAEARYVEEDNEVTGPRTAGNQGPGTILLCGQTGDCTNVAAIPYPPMQGLPASFAPAAILGYSTYERSESYVTPKATIQWVPTDDLNLYASYSEGEKPGGFSTITIGAFGLPPQPDVEFLPERIKVYELGATWTSPGRRLLLNGAYFYQDFTDKQVSSQVILGTTLGNRITNAGGAELQGLELSALWRATERLTLGGGLTHFFKYEYTDYRTLSGGAAEISRFTECEPVTTLTFNAAGVPAATTSCLLDRTGNKLEDTPETALALNASYRAPLGGGGMSWFADFDATYQGKRFIEDDNNIWLEAYWLGNLRLGLESDRWSALLYVDNVADDRKIKSGGTGPGNALAYFRTGIVSGAGLGARSVFAPQIPTGVFAVLPNPRTVGVRFNYSF